MSGILLEVWHAPPAILSAIELIKLDRTPVNENEVFTDHYYYNSEGKALYAVICANIKPHADVRFQRTTALLILHSTSHTVFASASKSKTFDTTRKTKNYKAYPPVTGDIVMFDSSKIHWLTGSNPPFQAFFCDWSLHKPTREEVEKRFADDLAVTL